MVGALLVRGMLAGLLAGILAFVYVRQFGEPAIDTAIAFESYVEYTVHHEEPEVELVSRALQSSAGLGTGTLVYGAAMGGILALVFAAAYGRLGPLAARGTAAVLGGLAFIAVYLVPFLKYPVNPPAIGNPETIQYRTAAYVAFILTSVLAMLAAVVLRQSLVRRFGAWDATLIAGGVYLAAMFVCYLLFPGIDEVPQQGLPGVVDAVTDADVTFPPSVLWGFRLASLGLQVVMWATITLVFGVLAERQMEPGLRPAAARAVQGAVAPGERA